MPGTNGGPEGALAVGLSIPTPDRHASPAEKKDSGTCLPRGEATSTKVTQFLRTEKVSTELTTTPKASANVAQFEALYQ